MLRLIVSYASSTGLQRAIVFLAVPFLSRYLTLGEIGEYALSQTTAQLVVPMMTWNATVALTREAIEHPKSTLRLHAYITASSFGVAGLAACVTLLNIGLPQWLAFGIALGSVEAAMSASLAILQGRESVNVVVGLSLARTLVFTAAIAIVVTCHLSLGSLLLMLTGSSASMALVACRLARRPLTLPAGGEREIVGPAQMIRYSAATLPHTAALWISLSSDRILLGMIWGKAALGSYVLAYTVAQSVMIVTSGIISALPPRIARFPEMWREPRHVIKFAVWTAVATFGVIFAALVFLVFNRSIFTLIEMLPANADLLVALLGVGFGSSTYYVLFASYMYLHRDTKALAYKAPIVGVVNLATMAAMVLAFEQVGACIGLLFSYASFAVVYGTVALRLEPSLRGIPLPVIAIQTVLLACSLLTARVIH